MNKIEKRYVITFLDAKKFALDRSMAELASVYGEQTYAKQAVEYWTHQVKLGSQIWRTKRSMTVRLLTMLMREF
jgi:hypothetical protein